MGIFIELNWEKVNWWYRREEKEGGGGGKERNLEDTFAAVLFCTEESWSKTPALTSPELCFAVLSNACGFEHDGSGSLLLLFPPTLGTKIIAFFQGSWWSFLMPIVLDITPAGQVWQHLIYNQAVNCDLLDFAQQDNMGARNGSCKPCSLSRHTASCSCYGEEAIALRKAGSGGVNTISYLSLRQQQKHFRLFQYLCLCQSPTELIVFLGLAPHFENFFLLEKYKQAFSHPSQGLFCASTES